MKSFLSLSAALALAALISSCQKESQAPAAQSASLQNANLNTTSSFSGTLSQTVNQGLIDYYPFHGNVKEGSGHNHDGYLENYNFNGTYSDATLTKNKYGIANEAYSFNGLSDAVIINPIFDYTKPVTQCSLYVRYKSNGYGTLLSSGDEFAFFDQYFLLSVLPDKSVTFSWGDYFPSVNSGGDIVATVSSGTLPAGCSNSWNDVVVNYSNSILTLYVNGRLLGTTTANFPSPARFDSNLEIAAQVTRYPQNFFNSAIDEVRVYNRPLTTDEISYLYAH